MTLAKRGLMWMLRSRTINSAVRALACARGRGLVLVYHRVGVFASPDCEIVPTVPLDVFRSHMQTLGEVADLVTLGELLTPIDDHGFRIRRRRPAVAITFDDDLPSHVAHVLPVLREMLVPAAFFLSGRALHGLGAYWFQQLEALLVAHGPSATAALLEAPSSTSGMLGLACERSPEMRRRVDQVVAHNSQPSVLQRDDIAALSAAGMTIGFHTLDHTVLPALDDVDLRHAIANGRNQLAGVAGTNIRFFAYPHGKADRRSARAVREGGFDAAFTGRPEAVGRRHDRYSIGRWEPGPLSVDELLVKLARYLHRAAVPAPA